ncbi:MAG TPA: DUF2161 family putative PD-(D/E)XK-type phosphodiesterase [Clostridia bacterium]|nr:DUF2161 family putative PD-(D/E)XK-type phosphodiesterase [Clostridia bacterium]
MKETDLFQPVKKLLEELGYDIRSEVKDADIAAMKDGELLIVELKTSYNLKLLIQAAKRQRLTESVYIAIPRPVYKKRFKRDFKDKEYLLKRLGLGLIFVAMDVEEPYASVIMDPCDFDMERSRVNSGRRKARLLEEYRGRSANYNKGGSVRAKLITAYREKALSVAFIMKDKDSVTGSEIKKDGGPPDATNILYNNYYGWFEKLGRGTYRLSDEGQRALEEGIEILKSIGLVKSE